MSVSKKCYVLSKYKQNVNHLSYSAIKNGLTGAEVSKTLEESFKVVSKPKHRQERSKCSRIVTTLTKWFFILFLLISFIYLLLRYHQPSHSLVLRNVQSLIYPILKGLRLLAVPVLKIFPSLSELYYESCLVENPFFYVPDMECWPCENVNTVIDLTGFKNQSLYQSGIPYTVKTDQKKITFQNLQLTYKRNRALFELEAHRLTSVRFKSAAELFDYHPKRKGNLHVVWRINKMKTARKIRELFRKPDFVTAWSGQSLERFIVLDEPKAEPYLLPNPECSYVVVVQGHGERAIVLKPSPECSQSCRAVSVVLKPSYALWYNWWYWRPLSLPIANNTDISITYITSYC